MIFLIAIIALLVMFKTVQNILDMDVEASDKHEEDVDETTSEPTQSEARNMYVYPTRYVKPHTQSQRTRHTLTPSDTHTPTVRQGGERMTIRARDRPRNLREEFIEWKRNIEEYDRLRSSLL